MNLIAAHKLSDVDYFLFLDAREGAGDSDVEALMSTFRMSEEDASVVYCRWLDSL